MTNNCLAASRYSIGDARCCVVFTFISHRIKCITTIDSEFCFPKNLKFLNQVGALAEVVSREIDVDSITWPTIASSSILGKTAKFPFCLADHLVHSWLNILLLSSVVDYFVILATAARYALKHLYILTIYNLIAKSVFTSIVWHPSRLSVRRRMYALPQSRKGIFRRTSLVILQC